MTNLNAAPAAEAPGNALGAFEPLPGVLPPEPLPAALARLRREAADEIERLIAFLDATDGDADLEDGGDDEPTGDELDFSVPTTLYGEQWRLRNLVPFQNEDDEDTHDAEAVNEDGGDILDEPHDGEDEEPNLGSYDRMVDQTHASSTPRGGWHAGQELGAPTPAEKVKAARRRYLSSRR